LSATSQHTPEELAVLAGVRAEGQAPVSYLRRSTGLDSRKIKRVLEGLEERGDVLRVFNAFGPQIPWWWRLAAPVGTDFAEPTIERGQIWDWGEPSNRLWVEVKAGRNQFGLPRVMVVAGENNQCDTVLPAHYFAKALHLRQRGVVSEWSSHFHCPIHGECSDEMVKTDKTCALCGSGLNRV
jgi:hypothetical protein